MTTEPAARARLRGAFQTLGFEVITFKGTEEAVLTHVPVEVRLTITASPAKGQDTTVDLAVALAGHGYTVAPHLSARLVRDRAHLADIVGRCREAGITGAFVVGGDAAASPIGFEHAHDLGGRPPGYQPDRRGPGRRSADPQSTLRCDLPQ